MDSPHSFSLRSFSSFDSFHRGGLRRHLPRYQTPSEHHSTSFYSAMEKGDLRGVLDLLQVMKTNKVFLQANVLKSIAFRLIKNDQRAFVEELFHQTEGRDPSLDLLTLLLYYTNNTQDFILMEQVLKRFLKSKELLSISEERLVKILPHLDKEAFINCFSSFQKLLVFIHARTGRSLTRCFWHFFERLGKMKDYERFLYLFNTMMELGIERDKYLDTILLRYLVLADKMEEVERVYTSTKEKDDKMYVAFLGSLAKMGKKEEIQRVLKDMNEKGAPMTHWVYNALFSTQGLSFAEIWELYNEMKTKNISPTSTTFVILIGRCGVHNKPEMIEKILLEMETSGIDVDSSVHTSVVKAYCVCDRADMAVDYILRVKEKRGVLLKDLVKILLDHSQMKSREEKMASLLTTLGRITSDVVPPELTDEILQILSNIHRSHREIID